MEPQRTAGSVQIALLTYNDVEADVVDDHLLSRPEFTGLVGNRYGLNSGEIEHFALRRAGNVQTAAFAAAHLTSSRFHFLVTYGCAGTPKKDLRCTQNSAGTWPCRNPYLVDSGRYHEHGQVEDLRQPDGSVSEAPTLKPTFRDRHNAFVFPLSMHVLSHAHWARFRSTPSHYRIGDPSLATAFVSEKVLTMTPRSRPPPVQPTLMKIPYRDALAEMGSEKAVVIEMESKGLAVGAPRYEFLTAVVRVATDHGDDKLSDPTNALQRERLNHHFDDLHDVLDCLTRSSPLSRKLFMLAIPTGAARESVRLGRDFDYEPRALAKRIAQLTVTMLEQYQPLLADIDRLDRAQLRRWFEESYQGDSYPELTTIPQSVEDFTEWTELVFACERPFHYGFDREPTQEMRIRQQATAVELAALARSQIAHALAPR